MLFDTVSEQKPVCLDGPYFCELTRDTGAVLKVFCYKTSGLPDARFPSQL